MSDPKCFTGTEQACAKFVMWALMSGSWQGADIDGGAAQDKAAELGLIVETIYDPEKHGPSDSCDAGDSWYVPTESLANLIGGVAQAAPERPNAVQQSVEAATKAIVGFCETSHTFDRKSEYVSGRIRRCIAIAAPQPLGDAYGQSGCGDHAAPGVLESDPARFNILNDALGTMHYHRLVSALNWNGYKITKDPQPATNACPPSDAFIQGVREALIEKCANVADDHTPAKHDGTLAAHVTGSTIAKAIRALTIPSTDGCARCGHPRAEHSYNGACYGLCGEFVSSVTSTHRQDAAK